MNYEELVRKMRTCIGDKKCFEKECRYWSELGCMDGNICCDAAAAIEELLSFAHYVADKVTMSDEDWEDYHEAFTEVACRKLVKLGVISIEDDMYVYRRDEPQEVQDGK